MSDTNKSNNEPTKETCIKAITDLLESINPKYIRRIHDYVYRWSKRGIEGA
ncbi:MAG: hypothetical protein RR812_03975 [Vagococcus sp.]